MINSTVTYRVLYYVAKILLGLFCRVRAIGIENIPAGAAIIYANHSHWSDPIYIMFAAGKFRQICYMAKAELFRIPPFALIARAAGAFPVHRGSGDTAAVDKAVEVLQSGKYFGIFPEGTRTKRDGAVRPKGGYIRIAERAGVPIVPVYLERKKGAFRTRTVVFGRPVSVSEMPTDETGKINYHSAAEKYMELVWQLRDELAGQAGKAVES